MSDLPPSESVDSTESVTDPIALDFAGTVVVTGASTGIGYATAQLLTRRGYRVLATVRKEEDAARLRSEFGPRVEPVLVDVIEDDQIAALAARAQELVGDQGLTGLVNNAGIAIAGPMMHIDLDDLRYQLDVNVVGVVAVTQALLPLLGARHGANHVPGRVVNISSVSAFTTYPFMGPYAASKHALEALNDAMRREFAVYGIPVISIVLGAVQTPIWDKAENQDLERYAETDFGKPMMTMHSMTKRLAATAMPVERAAALIGHALLTAKPRNRYVLANNWLLGWVIPRLLPERFLDWALRKQLGLERL